MNQEILRDVMQRGLLLDKEVFDIINLISDRGLAISILDNLERVSGQKMITKSILRNNEVLVKDILSNFSGGDELRFDYLFKEKKEVLVEVKKKIDGAQIGYSPDYKIYYANTLPDHKLEVKDFTGHFRARYYEIQKILMNRPEVQQNLISIGKIGGNRSSISLIGMVSEKKVTKNKNLLIKMEDLTGSISVLVKVDNEDLFSKFDELQLDDIVAVKGSGNRDMMFAHDIFYPDSFIYEKIKFEEDISIAFLSDLHCGSDRHLSQSLDNFLNWINSEDANAKKIRYLFFVGDNVDGVGIFPGQDKVLKLKSMDEQYKLLASYLSRIPKNITMFMCPGQHDAVRVAEPQPIINKRYAPYLYEIDNLVLVTNPSLIKLIEKDKEFKILMYHGASIHGFINEIKELRLMKAHNSPAKAVKHMLKRRHLAPSHGSFVYIPNIERDPLVISETPDILCTGEVHRLDIENYNGTIIITGSCWQAQTPFEEKVGNIPDPGKVPVFNLKTRELKIYDFGVEEEINREY